MLDEGWISGFRMGSLCRRLRGWGIFCGLDLQICRAMALGWAGWWVGCYFPDVSEGAEAA